MRRRRTISAHSQWLTGEVKPRSLDKLGMTAKEMQKVKPRRGKSRGLHQNGRFPEM